MAITSTTSKICSKLRHSSRSIRSLKGQVKKCASPPSRYNFLNHSFLPLVAVKPPLKYHFSKIEREYFKSLTNLEKLFGLKRFETKSLIYPVNITRSFEFAYDQLAKLKPDLRLVIVNDENHIATLATIDTFDTKQTLYYLEIEPLYDLLQNPKRRKTANLLLSIFAYLYQVIGIPHFREHNSYLYQTYSMVIDWFLDENYDDDDIDPNETQLQLNRNQDYIDNMLDCGDIVLKAMKGKRNLEYLGTRIASYKPATDTECSLLNVAKYATQLQADFPSRSIMDSIKTELFESEIQDNDKMFAENYLCFLWSFEDDLATSLMDAVNTELNECINIDEPLSIQFFDKPQLNEYHNHQFHFRAFELLNLVADLLTDFTKEIKGQKPTLLNIL